MRWLRVDPTRPDRAVLRPAAELLRSGGLVAFPTETVYGLGANALDEAAVQRVFTAKGRPRHNPLIVHAADTDAARALCRAWPAEAVRLAGAFWPGPLTLVLPKRPDIPDRVTAGLPSVAVRVPAHPVAAALLDDAGVPVAAPSANPSNAVSPTTAQHVAAGLGDRVDLIVDGGPCPVGIESAVVDLSGAAPVLLRPGTLTLAELREVVPALTSRGGAPRVGAASPAPGMLPRHYAPRARLVLVPPAEWERRVGALGSTDRGTAGALLIFASADVGHPVRMAADAGAYAAALYAALHALDAARCELILVEEPPSEPRWAGVRDRLFRAAHP